jgi:hypothetical protein
MTIPHSPEEDTVPIVFLISKKDVTYQTRGSTYCPGVSTPKTRGTTSPDGLNHLH